jgi:O-antigen/teichoic acid export membrane protein
VASIPSPSAPAAAGLRRNPLPQGTLGVGVGLVIGGVAQYGFLAIASRTLGPDAYSPLASFWAWIFVLGPGFFLPLEQELGRSLTARRLRGQGGRPLVLLAGMVGGALLVVLLAACGVAHQPLSDHLFDGNEVLVAALGAGLAGYLGQFLTRGTLLGSARFGSYGAVLGLEGVLRIVFAAALGVLGVHVAGYFGLTLVIATIVGTSVVFAARRGVLQPGPPASMSELSRALGFLLISSFCTQFLLNVGTDAVQLLATPAQQAAAGKFLDCRIIAFIPIFLLQAVQGPLLAKLSGLAATGRRAEFRTTVLEMLGIVAALGALSVAGLALLGPLVTRLLFGGGFELGNLDFALLGLACALFMVAQVLNQSLIALAGYSRATAGWVTGAAAFIIVTVLGSSLFLRVEEGLLAGAVSTSLVMGLLLAKLIWTAAPVSEALLTSPPIPEA